MTDEHFANYLREFEPRKPRTLPIELLEKKTNPRFDGWKRLVAAVVLISICGTLLWTGWRQKPVAQSAKSGKSLKLVTETAEEGRKKTTFQLTKAALEDSAAFEAILRQESQKSLPKFEEPDSALRALTKE